MVSGEVVYVSADALPDDTAGQQQVRSDVYVARVHPRCRRSGRLSGGFEPTPGMPAEVYIKTAERVLDYLLRPLRDTMCAGVPRGLRPARCGRGLPQVGRRRAGKRRRDDRTASSRMRGGCLLAVRQRRPRRAAGRRGDVPDGRHRRRAFHRGARRQGTRRGPDCPSPSSCHGQSRDIGQREKVTARGYMRTAREFVRRGWLAVVVVRRQVRQVRRRAALCSAGLPQRRLCDRARRADRRSRCGHPGHLAPGRRRSQPDHCARRVGGRHVGRLQDRNLMLAEGLAHDVEPGRKGA